MTLPDDEGPGRAPKLPRCGQRVPLDDGELVCDRRHAPGQGHHQDSTRGVHFDLYRGELRTSPVGWRPGEQFEPLAVGAGAGSDARGSE